MFPTRCSRVTKCHQQADDLLAAFPPRMKLKLLRKRILIVMCMYTTLIKPQPLVWHTSQQLERFCSGINSKTRSFTPTVWRLLFLSSFFVLMTIYFLLQLFVASLKYYQASKITTTVTQSMVFIHTRRLLSASTKWVTDELAWLLRYKPFNRVNGFVHFHCSIRT